MYTIDSNQLQFLYQIKNAAPFVITIIIGYTGIKLINLTNELPRFKNIRAGSIALSQILLGLGIWLSLNSFTNTYINKIGLIFFSGMAVLAVCSLAAYGGKSKIFVISKASHWLNQSYSGKFIIAESLAIYIIFIHPLVMNGP
ncbi:MAG: hypothetical protein NTV30_06505 [Chloroflexi bacterium]|nr:hypothetical protein [Chloroflexota bacterium]